MEAIDLIGKNVKVYWNFRKKCFSVQHNGKVVAHVDSIYIDSPTFKVSDAGRQRVLRDKRKNVHAYVVGVVCNSNSFDHNLMARVSYNPYKNATFVFDALQYPIRDAQIAHLTDGKIFVGYKLT